MANRLNPRLTGETLGVFFREQQKEWLTTREIADMLDLSPQAAYGRLTRLRYVGWLRTRERAVLPGRRIRRDEYGNSLNAYVSEWGLTQKGRRARTASVPGVAVPTPVPARPVEIEEIFYRQRRNLGQTER